MLRPARPRIALAHDWLSGYRGGEGVLERLARLTLAHFLPAGLFTLFDGAGPIAPAIDRLRRVTPALSSAPWLARGARRWLLPAYPVLVDALGRRLLSEHRERPIDLVVSTSSSAIKSLRPPPGVPHVCYCFSPARYVWSRLDDYAAGSGLRALGLRSAAAWFRDWDRRTVGRVTRFVTLSRFIARQIEEFFGRAADIVYPPVRTGWFTPEPDTPREDFWLSVGALEPYKRVDLAIEAAKLAGARLVIVGEGSESARLRALAAGAHGSSSASAIEFRGRVDDRCLRDLYRRARLLIFPQVEDFGIVAGEALACGTPVVARRDGAAPEIVDDTTGAFFDEPVPRAVVEATERCPRSGSQDVISACRAGALRFAPARFDESMLRIMRAALPA